MKYAFFGTPEFAAAALKELIGAGLPPALVVTNPDRPVGRKKIPTPPPAKTAAEEAGIPVVQPEKLKEIEDLLREEKFDAFVVAAYAKIIPGRIINLASLGALGIHPSLLPRYRGSSPIQSAILSGEKETGITLYLLDEKMDHGPMLAKQTVPLAGTETTSGLMRDLAVLGGRMAARFLPDLKGAPREAQDESLATYTGKFTTEDAKIGESDLKKALDGEAGFAEKIDRMIRAFTPEPGAWTIKDGKRLKLLKAEVKDGKLILKRTQKEGGLPIDH